MKYAFMSFSCPELTLADSSRLALEKGYTGFEPRLGEGHMHRIETNTPHQELIALRDMALDLGIDLCCLATSCAFADASKASGHIDTAKRVIALAQTMKVPRIRVFGGTIPEGVSREAAIEQVASSLLVLSDEIGNSDVTICMETHDSWCEPAHVAQVMRMVNRNNIAVNWDIMHPVLTANRSIQAAYECLKPWIHHVHFHDGTREGNNLDFLPIGKGKIDHKSALACLMKDGYSGYMSGEWISWNEPDYLRIERNTLSKLEEEVKCSI